MLLSGGASVAVRFTYAELPPFWGAAARFLCGAAFFWLVTLLQRIPLPRGRALVGVSLFGVLGMGLPFMLMYWGLVTTPASLYQTLLALTPLLTVLLAAAHRLEPLRPRGLAGAALTVAGIVVAVGGVPAEDVQLARVAAILLAAACLAGAGIVVKSYPPVDRVATNAVAMTVGGIILLIASLIAREPWVIPVEPTTWVAFGYLVVAVTIATFLLYLYVVRRWTASGTSYGFVLIPLVTVVLATTLAGERITAQFLVGGALVLLGVWLGALMRRR